MRRANCPDADLLDLAGVDAAAYRAAVVDHQAVLGEAEAEYQRQRALEDERLVAAEADRDALAAAIDAGEPEPEPEATRALEERLAASGRRREALKKVIADRRQRIDDTLTPTVVAEIAAAATKGEDEARREMSRALVKLEATYMKMARLRGLRLWAVSDNPKAGVGPTGILASLRQRSTDERYREVGAILGEVAEALAFAETQDTTPAQRAA